MPRRRESRIYSRNQGGQKRYYGDFRDYADVGGGREALIPEGLRQASSDPDVAQRLATARLQELEAKRKGVQLLGVTKRSGFASYAPIISYKRSGSAKRPTMS